MQETDARADVDALFEAAPTASVHVKSGRTFVGFVDARTDADTLWLRFEHAGAKLWRPIAWHRVVQASVGDESFSAEAFRRDAKRSVSTEVASGPDLPRPAAAGESSRGNAKNDAAANDVAGIPTVRALSLDVRLANWDADAEDDGLVAAVAPLDDAGRAVAAMGTLTVELIGMTGPRTPNWAGIAVAEKQRRPTLETWTVQLTADQFIDGVAQVRLPFTAGDPADDLRLGSFGVVRARFASPGSELVEAELDPVRLRPLGRIGLAR